MKIIFLSNALTPHQAPICEAFVAMKDIDFKFIEIKKGVNKQNLPIGWRYLEHPSYLITNDLFEEDKAKYQEEIDTADVVIISGCHPNLIDKRIKNGRNTFIYSERIYRKFNDYLKFPHHIFKFNKVYNKSDNLFLLSPGKFANNDYRLLGCFKNRSYKWGYFIEAPKIEFRKLIDQKTSPHKIKILWASRLIDVKHPELPIMLAKELKKHHYDFEINMYGIGPLQNQVLSNIQKNTVNDCVNLYGQISNSQLMNEMQMHDIFIFTSDQGEGWGVVANEAMANCCAIVCSNKIGAATYLIDDGENGLIFRNKSIKSLVNKVAFLIENPDKRLQISLNAHNTISQTWSPTAAARNFVQLVNDISSQKESSIKSGPCSQA